VAIFLRWATDLNLWGNGLAARAAKTARSGACTG
jgi:hypothetical protein